MAAADLKRGFESTLSEPRSPRDATAENETDRSGTRTVTYTIHHIHEQDAHRWAMASAACDINDSGDTLVVGTANLVRIAYGEGKVEHDAQQLFSTEISEGAFSVDYLLAALRAGLPDPAAEGAKPTALTNYRSQTCEIVARAALAAAFNYEFPASAQEGSTNPNQPILGFDGWGFCKSNDNEYALALIQVKGTDDPSSPPSVARELMTECQAVPLSISAICRALTVLARHLRGSDFQRLAIQMLEKMGKGTFPQILISPAIVRGRTPAHLNDLQPIREIADAISPATLYGLVLALGVSLSDFGRIVMERARQPL